MKYFVTYASMDEKLGSNPMWHSCLFFSVYEEQTQKINVETSWSFYGLPPTEEDNSLNRKVKKYLKLDVNFSGTHGKWKQEETRFLDRGEGIHGRTYELTKELYHSLLKKMNEKRAAEDAAIADAAKDLNLQPKTTYRIYSYENKAIEIFQHEQEKAKKEGRESRLKPFLFKASIGLRGLHFRNSHTCKSQAIEALEETLTSEQINELTENGKHPTVPHFSGPVEQVIFHSTGAFSTHEKSSGEKTIYRSAIGSKHFDNEEPVQVFWSVPPQKYDACTLDTESLFYIPYANEVKDVVSRLQRIEWKLRNAKLNSSSETKREQLLVTIVASYQIFSVIKNKESLGNTSSKPSFFKTPQAEAEMRMQLINTAKFLKTIQHELNQGDLIFETKKDKDEINAILEPNYFGQLYGWVKTEAIPRLFR